MTTPTATRGPGRESLPSLCRHGMCHGCPENGSPCTVNHVTTREIMENPAPPATVASPRGRVRGAFHRHPGLHEVGIFLAALVVYQLSRALVIGDPGQAVSNTMHIVRWEQASGLFVELSIQQWLVQHLAFTELLNLFYMYAHRIVTTAFFVWLYHRRRRIYPYIRNGFLAANGIALVVYMLFPVAPPRVLPTDGFIDTLRGVSDIDLHGGALSGWFNPNAAVPSMHFGYAFMIAVVACFLLDSWPLRMLALSYPALVFLTITGTGNHFVLDCLAGGAVMGMGFLLAQAWTLLFPSHPAPVVAFARTRSATPRR